MFPLQDTIRSRSFAIINWLLIGANAFVFFFEVSLPPELLERLIFTFGLVPEKVNWFNPFTWIPFISHMFLHGGWFHFVSNVWILYIFGDNVEDRMGSMRYLIFYISGGIAAGLSQYFFNTDPSIPAIGASGAIAAVMGAYLIFFPRSRVITLVPVFIFPWFVQIPAVIFLGVWFVSQLFSGFLSLAVPSDMQMGGVAWFAHIGGFIFGFILANLFAVRRKKARYYADEYFPW
jgi:membrane associated rhomboid family serine protease